MTKTAPRAGGAEIARDRLEHGARASGEQRAHGRWRAGARGDAPRRPAPAPPPAPGRGIAIAERAAGWRSGSAAPWSASLEKNQHLDRFSALRNAIPGRPASTPSLSARASPAASSPSASRRVCGQRVLIVDKRPHIGGNAYDRHDDAGILVHPYGPHIFHTNSAEIFEYLSQFTEWRPYQHRVLASVDGQQLPMPINLDTVNRLYGLNLTSFEMQGWLDSVAEKLDRIETSEDAVVAKVGRDLYKKFFRGYTRKQWGLDPSRARRERHRARADADQPRRPLLRRHLPGDAAPRLHADVREDARPPEHQDHAQHRLSRDRRPRAVEAHGLHRPDRRVLQPSVRQAAVPQPRVPPRQPAAGAVPAGRHGQLSERLRLHADQRVQAHHRAETARARRSSTSTRGPRATRTTRCRGPRTRRSTSSTRTTPSSSPTSPSSAASRPTSTTTWTRSSARR